MEESLNLEECFETKEGYERYLGGVREAVALLLINKNASEQVAVCRNELMPYFSKLLNLDIASKYELEALKVVVNSVITLTMEHGKANVPFDKVMQVLQLVNGLYRAWPSEEDSAKIEDNYEALAGIFNDYKFIYEETQKVGFIEIGKDEEIGILSALVKLGLCNGPWKRSKVGLEELVKELLPLFKDKKKYNATFINKVFRLAFDKKYPKTEGTVELQLKKIEEEAALAKNRVPSMEISVVKVDALPPMTQKELDEIRNGLGLITSQEEQVAK